MAPRSGSSRGRLVLAMTAAAVAAYTYNQRKKALKKQQRSGPESKTEVIASQGSNGRPRRKLDKDFVKKLKYLLKIVIPGIRSKEFFLLSLHTGFLVIRTFLSIYIAGLDGVLVKTIVNQNGSQFAIELAKWLGVGIPATYVNAMIRYLESKLAIAFRTKLTTHAVELYMKNDVYYRVSNLDDRISNADQCLTSDISNFCDHLAHIYSHVSKPILDVILMSGQLFMLSKSRGTSKASSLSSLIGVSAFLLTNQLLRKLAPPFGKYIQEQARKEGEYRACHARLITHAEEVAFYGGHNAEKGLLMQAYITLVKHQNMLYRVRVPYSMLEGFLMKYLWGASGMLMIAIPAFAGKTETRHDDMSQQQLEAQVADESSTRTQDFIIARRLLLDCADALERVMSSYKEILELAGFASRVHEMFHVFEDVGEAKYSRKMVEGQGAEIMQSGAGQCVVGDTVKLDDVPIMTPNGDLLANHVSFEIKPGMHLLITGPNGCGKSSLFRILGGLWPVYGGSVERPHSMFYIPQKAYLVTGSLRDQVIYPDTVQDMRRKLHSDRDLEAIFEEVYLGHILTREGGWDAVSEWADVLSGGEKQRLAMARLFYHKPRYAILDECTSAVSIDVEGKMYTHARDLGISLLTVTHRPSLWKYHNYLLQFDGEGGWKFNEMNATARMSLKEEKSKIESQLSGVEGMRKRLVEICGQLGESSVCLGEQAPVLEDITSPHLGD